MYLDAVMSSDFDADPLFNAVPEQVEAWLKDREDLTGLWVVLGDSMKLISAESYLKESAEKS